MRLLNFGQNFDRIKAHKERCLSGLRCRSRKAVYLQRYREFESHPLRQVLHSAKLKEVASA